MNRKCLTIESALKNKDISDKFELTLFFIQLFYKNHENMYNELFIHEGELYHFCYNQIARNLINKTLLEEDLREYIYKNYRKKYIQTSN